MKVLFSSHEISEGKGGVFRRCIPQVRLKYKRKIRNFLKTFCPRLWLGCCFMALIENTISWLKMQLLKAFCWLHTRARKYNLSALGTYFECERVKRTYLNFSQ